MTWKVWPLRDRWLAKRGPALRMRGRSADRAVRPASLRAMHADYGFEYSEEEQDEEDVDIENQYYNAKGAHASCMHAHVMRRAGRISRAADHKVWHVHPQACKTLTTHARPSTASTRWSRWRAPRASGELQRLIPPLLWSCLSTMIAHPSITPSPSLLLLLTHSPSRGFKALKQLVKLYYRLKKYDKMMESYR
jgi:hypothetical protein